MKTSAKVDTLHKDYSKYCDQWEKCEICREGEEAVKAQGVKFLPKLSKQDQAGYNSYKMRAMFYNATERTLQGLQGAVFAKQPIFHLNDDEDEEFFDSLSLDGIPFIDMAKNVFFEVLCPSRVGLLADVPKDDDGGEAYITSYRATDILNWKTKVIAGKQKLVLLVLHECVETDTDDEFVTVETSQWRILDLVETQPKEYQYRQRIYQKNNSPESQKDEFVQIGDDIWPTKQGRPLDTIPFVIINPSKIGPDVEKPLAIDMVNVNFSHYRSSADLEHGRHFTGLPTAWVAGFDAKRTELIIGSTVAWVSANPHAHAGFLEFTGQGLKALENALKEKEKLLTILGARILEGQKDAVENAETQKVRRLGENSILANIANTVSVGLTQIVQFVADWRNKGKVRIKLNDEYTSVQADAQTLQAAMAALQQGALSFDSWFFNLKKWQMVPIERTIEDELGLIDARRGEFSFTTTASDTGANLTAVKQRVVTNTNGDSEGNRQQQEEEQ